jgi:hypothetical protein
VADGFADPSRERLNFGLRAHFFCRKMTVKGAHTLATAPGSCGVVRLGMNKQTRGAVSATRTTPLAYSAMTPSSTELIVSHKWVSGHEILGGRSPVGS